MRLSLLVLMLLVFLGASAQRKEVLLKDWTFTRTDNPAHADVVCNDMKWEKVTVPHDWAIAGPFDKEIDKQVVAIVQNGEKEATEKTGRSGSLPWIGTGWYRTHAVIDPSAERVLLNFDGAMSEPEVFVNGKKAGEWKYGYSSFNIDITPYINKMTSDNVIAVRLQNVEESSRWYPGAGLYRPVTLIQTRRAALRQWGVVVNTISINAAESKANVLLKACVEGCSDGAVVTFMIAGQSFAAKVHDTVAETVAVVEGVKFWSPESPVLYDVTVTLRNGDAEVDRVVKRTGFRTVSCSADGGFRLNGASRKIKGVCLHHDLGMLGAAVNRAALQRQLELLKSMGCDAIRTSHNMPSQMQMDLCDSLGMMVMAESFDMWVYPKCKNGYARFFKEWSDRDIENLICANRLHPSIVMWSVGNEIPEQGSADGPAMLRHLQDQVRKYDTTRPITNGMDRAQPALKTGFAQVSEVPGMNYRTHIYESVYQKLGQGYILGSETASTVSSRGVYKFPVERQDNKAWSDGQCSSYDVEACWWANIPEDDWLLQDDRDWVIGEFVWTGFDYLGEPTPYDEYWPSRSSYFGIFDLAGLPKDRYYLYRSMWNKQDATIHLLPHWTWHGREGEVTPVYCYTSYPSAELFVNGKSQGRIYKGTATKEKIDKRITDISDPVIDRYRLRWNDVRYEPGEIKVVCYDASGNAVGEETIKTAGKPSMLRITGDMGKKVRNLMAGGSDMVFLTVDVVDKDGNLCPDAALQAKVEVKGAATFKGICNGDATSLEVFTRPTMKTFHGKLVIGIQSKQKAGDVTVTVKASGVKPAVLKLRCE